MNKSINMNLWQFTVFKISLAYYTVALFYQSLDNLVMQT